MKPSLRDYLTIFAALVAIFISGYGVGHLVGEKKGRENAPPPTLSLAVDESSLPWQQRTLENLSRDLNLNRNQKKIIAAEIQQVSQQIRKTKDSALRQKHRHLLELCDRIAPELTREQVEQLKKVRTNLEKMIISPS